MILTCSKPVEFFRICFDLRHLFNVRERRRVRLSLVQAGDRMGDDQVAWVGEENRSDERISILVAARL